MVTLFLVHAKVSSPVLVIHGTEDDVIDFSHGLAIYEKCPRAVEPLWVEVRQIEMGCPFGDFCRFSARGVSERKKWHR